MHAVKVADVLVAVVCGVVELGPEVAGYLVLEGAERLREVGFGRADPNNVTVDTEGNVAVVDAAQLDDVGSTRALRSLLDVLLQHTPRSTAKLRLCACRPEDTGLALLVRELEGALSPLDRKAMRAQLAKLARTAWEAAADGTFAQDDAPAVVDWSPKAEPEPEPISFAVTVVRSPPPAAPEPPNKHGIEVPVTQTLAQSPRPTAALPSVFTETLNQSPRAKDTLPPDAVPDDIGALRAEIARLQAALVEATTDRDRRLSLVEKERDRRLASVEADRARRVQEAEDERDRRVRDAEHERDRRVCDLEQELAKKISVLEIERDRKLLARERALEAAAARHSEALAELQIEREKERAESDALRGRQIEEAAAKVRAVAESARDRAIDALKVAHEGELRALRTGHEMERKVLKERVDELEYALARANAERDAERTLRVDGEVAAANRYRELRRNVPGKPPEEPRAIGYRDVEPPVTSDRDRKWWK